MRWQVCVPDCGNFIRHLCGEALSGCLIGSHNGIRSNIGDIVKRRWHRIHDRAKCGNAWSAELKLYWQASMLDSPGVDEVRHAVVRAARNLTATT